MSFDHIDNYVQHAISCLKLEMNFAHWVDFYVPVSLLFTIEN